MPKILYPNKEVNQALASFPPLESLNLDYRRTSSGPLLHEPCPHAKLIYCDAEHNLLLRRQLGGLVLAVVGFEQAESSLNIIQLQGMRDPHKTLSFYPQWERYLIECVAHCALHMSKCFVQIQCAEDNKYYTVRKCRKLDPKEDALNRRLKRRYNGTARGLGFRKIQDKYYRCWWQKEVTNT